MNQPNRKDLLSAQQDMLYLLDRIQEIVQQSDVIPDTLSDAYLQEGRHFLIQGMDRILKTSV